MKSQLHKSILFAADNHYGTHGGKALCECLGNAYDIKFVEDDWSCFLDADLANRYSLLILNMISGTCDVDLPSPGAERNIRAYLETGRPLFLLHGASAAFWQWDWWRNIMGIRWVRPNDPDGCEPSHHPSRPYTLKSARSRHPLCRKLQEVAFPKDEIYMNLAKTCPTITLMETTTDEGTFPMCYETITPWHGRIVGYLPGHSAQVVRLSPNVLNCRMIIDWLLDQSHPCSEARSGTC